MEVWGGETATTEVGAEAPAAEKPIQITSVVETAQNLFFFQKTLSQPEKEAIYEIRYGDLPHELRAKREEEEQHWMAPKPGQTYEQLESKPFLNPERTYLIGTNGVFAVAFQANDDDSVPPPPKEPEPEQKKELSQSEKAEKLEKYYEWYACKNPAFALKTYERFFERKNYYLCKKFEIRQLCLQKDAHLLMQDVLSIAKVDPTMREPITKLGTAISKKLKTLPISFKKGKTRPPQMAEERPGKSYAAVRYVEFPFADPVTERQLEFITATPTQSVYRLLLCKTPTANKKTTWKDIDHVIVTRSKTVPACGMNDTHLVVVYEPLTEKAEDEGIIFIDLFEFIPSAIRLKKVDRFYFRLPPMLVEMTGLVSVHLSREMIFSMTFANHAFCFDVLRQIKPTVVSAIKLETDDPKFARLVTTAPVYHPRTEFRNPESTEKWAGTVLIGTDKGECYGVDWQNGTVFFVNHAPAVEHVFATHYTAGKVFMQTVMGISGRISNMEAEDALTVLPIDRPVAMDTCGGLIFVITKYGLIKILSCLVRGVSREFPPPEGGARTVLFQVAYKGMKAYHDHLVCVYPNGIIRKISLK